MAFLLLNSNLLLVYNFSPWVASTFQIVLEADGYQPYLISPEKGLRSLIKGVLELAKEPSRLCVDEVIELYEVVLLHVCFYII